MDRGYREEFKTAAGLSGKVRCLEVTYGKSGWHPHMHVLLFVDSIENIQHTEESLLAIWKKAVVRLGFDAPNHHGLTLQDGSKAAANVSKWGLPDEINKGIVRKSSDGFNPFDLLRVIVGTYTGTGLNVDAARARMLFKEYGVQFKGERQLVWSNGLKKHFGVGEKWELC